MSIKVRYFASLRESIGKESDEIETQDIHTVCQVWSTANPSIPLPINVLAAINMEYVSLQAPVKDGDVVAFFPPVTGG